MREPMRVSADEPEIPWGVGAPEPRREDLHPFPVDGPARDPIAAARAAPWPSAPPLSPAPSAGGPEAHAAAEHGAALADFPAEPPPEDLHPEEPPAPEIVYLDGGPGIARIPLEHPFRVGEREVREILVPPVSIGVEMDFDAGLLPTLADIAIAVIGEDLAVFRALRGRDKVAVLKAVRNVLTPTIRHALRRAES